MENVLPSMIFFNTFFFFVNSPVCRHWMTLSDTWQRCLTIKHNMTHWMFFHIYTRLDHSLWFGDNNAARICGCLYFTCKHQKVIKCERAGALERKSKSEIVSIFKVINMGIFEVVLCKNCSKFWKLS